MKKLIILFSFISLISACGGGKTPEAGTGTNPYSTGETASGTPEYDPNRGLGKWTAENVNVGATLDPTMAAAGEKIQAVKCVSCHKLTEEKLVGPGWKGVTQRRKAAGPPLGHAGHGRQMGDPPQASGAGKRGLHPVRRRRRRSPRNP